MAKAALARGDVLLFTVSRGHAVALRAVAVDGDDTCVVATEWTGPATSAWSTLKADARLLEVKAVAHHDRRRPMLGAWLSEAPPHSLVRAGRRTGPVPQVVHPRDYVNAPAGKGAGVLPLLGWKTFLDEVKLQWRWDEDRDALLKEEADDQAQRLSAFHAAVRGRG